MKKDKFSVTIIIQLILLLFFYFFKESLLIDSIDDSETKPLFYPYEYYFVLTAPAVLISISFLVGTIFKIVTTSESNNQSQETTNKEHVFNNLSKFIFFANICLSLESLIAIIYLALTKKQYSHEIYQFGTIIFSFSLIVFLLSNFIGFILFLAKKNWKPYKWISISMLIISVVVFLAPLFYTINTLKELKSVTIIPSEINEKINQLDESQAAQEASNYKEKEEESIYVDFSEIESDNIKTGKYFCDLWENPEDDKDNVSYVIKTYFNKYLFLTKKGSLSALKDSYSMQGFESKDEKVEKVRDKIETKSERIIAAYKSYKDLFYNILSNNVYTNSGLKTGVKSLICTHNDLYKSGNEIKNLENISVIMETRFKHDNYTAQSYYNLIKPYASDDLFDILQSKSEIIEIDETKSTPSEQTKALVVWAYSFWARRHSENNDNEIFEILTNIDEHYKN